MFLIILFQNFTNPLNIIGLLHVHIENKRIFVIDHPLKARLWKIIIPRELEMQSILTSLWILDHKAEKHVVQ